MCLKEITWRELRTFTNEIPEEFLDKKVNVLVSDNNMGIKMNEPLFLEEDVYCHKNGFLEDDCGPLADIMEMDEDKDPSNYEVITKKGTPFLWIENVD